MKDLLIHPTSRFALTALIKQAPHALLLLGPEGIGKRSVAQKWAAAVTAASMQIIEPDEKGSISIETIRQLYVSSRNKQTIQQIILVDQAQVMSLEAQNAFLKLLEEPTPGIVFILTAPQPAALLSTIVSRTQAIWLQPLDNKTMEAFLTTQNPQLTQQEKAQLLFIAQGRPGIAARLLKDPHFLESEMAFMQHAKQLLNAKPYQRYLAISKLSDRATCIATLQAMLYMSNLQLSTSKERRLTTHWLKINDALQLTLEHITHNGNIKAQLLRLFASW